jgi:hypothetical protein
VDPTSVAGGGGGVVRSVSGQAERGAGDLVLGVYGAGGGRQYVGVDRAGDDGCIVWEGVERQGRRIRMERYLFAEFYTIIGMIEEFFDAKRFVLNTERMKHLQKYGYSGLELEDNSSEIKAILNNEENIGNEMDLGILEILGIQLFRRYFFVSTYQFFVNILGNFCKRVEDELHPFNEKRSCIYDYRNYLKTNVAKINIPPDNLWRTITIYNKLRNCIVHHDARVISDQKGNALCNYVKDHPFLHFEEIDGEIIDEIFFDKGFCEEAMDNFEIFLAKLDDQLNDYPY